MSTQKPWDRPWSMEEIIENSDKWNLAGDVALLNTLKSFADNLLSKTTEINNNLNNLTNGLNETSLQLNIAQNEFQSLRNSQFIESRVYEDDETLPPTENTEKVEEKPEPDRTEDIRLAAVKGLEVLEQYFEKIEVSVSDSEDEDIDLPNYVLRPKDLYIDRPLPYVIGTEEWHKKWHVGLEDSSSDSETEKVSDKFSESDSESDLPIIQDRSQIKGTSDTSSELDFSQKTKNIKQDLFQSSDSEDLNSISNKNFAEELAAKLGNVIQQEYQEPEPEINKRPIQKKPQYGDLFFDEPPPLDEPKGLFSGGSGLFDDDEDVPYSAPVESRVEESPKKSGLFDEEHSDVDDIFSTGSKPVFPSNKPPLFSEEPPALDEKKKPVGGVSIFGGKDLFNKKLLKRQPSSSDEESEEPIKEDKVINKKINLFSDDDDDLFKSEEKSVKNPSKKINLFDSDEDSKSNLFDEQSPKRIDQKSKDNLFESPKQEDKPKEVKKTSLFDDDDLFKDDLFSSNTKSKFTSGLFDDSIENDLFSTKDEPKPTKNLFEDLMAIPDDQNSINQSESKDSVTPDEREVAVNSDESVSKVPSNLFEDIPESKDPLFGDLETDQTAYSKPEAPKPKPRISLFDSPPPETDDLFSDENIILKKDDIFKVTDSSEKPHASEEKPKTSIFEDHDNLFGDKPEKLFPPVLEKDIFADLQRGEEPKPVKITVPSMRLFDPVPPPVDDWDTKSESDDNQSFLEQEESDDQKSNLFSEEPPSLDIPPITNLSSIKEKLQNEPVKEEIKPNVSSPPGKLKHNLNINVSALMPGSLPPRRGEVQKVPSAVDKSEENSFDTTDNVEVLHSITKDRVKVPFHRRPSTRRGRKAALKNTSSDFKLDQEEFENVKDEIISNPVVIEPSKNEDLFDTKPAKPSAPKSDLFGEDDDDDDIFINKKVPVSQTKITKKSLFDDDSDDDDIFKSSTESRVKNPEIKVATEKKIAKVSTVKKLENTKVDDDDPLSALLK